jgi:NTP pyrophosphatase (non-canonical NTP hydrolase)
MLDNMAKMIHKNAVEKGFWEPNTEGNHTIFYLKQIAMIHSECSEVLEAIRKEKGEQEVVEEIADILIRTLDLYAGLVVDKYTSLSLDEMMTNKIIINSTRPEMHGVLA